MAEELKRRFHVAIVAVVCIIFFHISKPKSEFALGQSMEKQITLPKVKSAELMKDVAFSRDPFRIGEALQASGEILVAKAGGEKAAKGSEHLTGAVKESTGEKMAQDEGGEIKTKEAVVITEPKEPSIWIDGIIYSKDKKGRFVSINGQLFEEGSSFSGAKIEKIYDSKVLFLYKKKRITKYLSIGNMNIIKKE